MSSHCMVVMPFKYKRICPICGKESLGNISSHLQQVHKLNSVERKPYLKKTKYQGITVYSKDEIQSLPVVHISETRKCSKRKIPSLNEEKQVVHHTPVLRKRKQKRKKWLITL